MWVLVCIFRFLLQLLVEHWFTESVCGLPMSYLQVILLNEDGTVLGSKYLKSVECVETGRDYEFSNFLVQICEPRTLPVGKSRKSKSIPLVQYLYFAVVYGHIYPMESWWRMWNSSSRKLDSMSKIEFLSWRCMLVPWLKYLATFQITPMGVLCNKLLVGVQEWTS